MNKKVTVIIPARNEEENISKAIDSVINQSYKNLEILVLDDASIDNTGEIIKAYCLKDKRVKYIKGNGVGVANARNLLFDLATGEFIANQDADDISRFDRIERQLELATKINAKCIVGCFMEVYKNNEFFGVQEFPVDNTLMKKKLSNYFGRFVISPQASFGSTELYKRTKVNEKYKIMSDWDQFLRIIENEKVILGNVQLPLYRYNINKGSLSQNKFPRALYASFLRENERRRKNSKNEFETLNEYIKSFWRNPKSLLVNTSFIFAKYIQQYKIF